MSTVNVKPSRSASDSVGYALYGNDKDKRTEHVQTGTDRAAAMSCSVESPWAFVARAEALARAHGRKNELYSYTQNFSPDEFGKNDRGHVQRVNELGVKLAERMHSADHLVVTHADSAGGHLHNHIYVINHDNLTGKSLQRNTSWKNGLRQANDELMQDEGCQVLPSPEQAKPDWSQRQEDFASVGFERILGDKVAASLRDKRSVDRAGFTEVLDEHGVALAETQRDGWTYKMRRADNGKLGRKKASGLTPEFTAEGAQQIFEFHENNRPKEQSNEHSRRNNEQQETEPSSTASNLSEPTNADVIAAVNRQTKAVNGLKSYLRIAIEETVKEELKGLPSTLQPSVNKSPQIESVESRLSEIESTLREFAQSLDGKQLQSASQSLIAEAQMNRAATASAAEKLQSLAEDNQKLVSQVGGAVQRIEKRTEERVEKAVEQVAGEASATMTANIDASNERAERIIAATATLGARQLWSVAAAMRLALLPVVVVVAGLWMGIAGLITGAQWAVDVDGSVWLGIGRWLAVGAGLAGAGYALFASVRWVAGLVETWKGRGMPTWPSWRKR